MNRPLFCVFNAVLTSSFLLSNPLRAAPPTTQPDLATENAALKEKVTRLEAEVQRLRSALARAQLRDGFAPRPREPYSLTPRPQPPRLPPGSVPRQFNGMTYYLVPLEGSDADASIPSGRVWVAPSGSATRP
jgi:hypothetical protein